MRFRPNLIGKIKNTPIALSLITLVFCLFGAKEVRTQTLTVPENLVSLNSAEGEKLLLESQAIKDYFPLSIQYVTQDHPAYCGVASSVMILNALSVPAPIAPEFRTYHFFNQANLFDNPQTQQVMTADLVKKGGMTLEQLGKILQSYPVETVVYHGDDVTLDEFRSSLVKNLQQPNNFILVNYDRDAIAQKGGGHISPVAAYNDKSDRFLVLDVSRYKYPPIWVKTEELWQAINTVDPSSKKTRGFVLVSNRQ
jgi:hypothetical protein